MKKLDDDYQIISVKLRPHTEEDISSYVFKLIDFLDKLKKKILFINSEEKRIEEMFEQHSKTIPRSITFVDEHEFYTHTTLIVSMGGDGTIIGACRKAHRKPAPIFGVNLGDLGFITEFSKEDFVEHLGKFFQGKYEVTPQPLFCAKIFSNGEVRHKELFFNDASISRSNISRVITISLKSDNEHIFNTSGDGLIISSPIGSTAYSLSAGGPIVHPQVKAMTITPICPHSLTHRPLVISDHSVLEIQLLDSNNSATLTLDGQSALPISQNDKIVVQKEKKISVLIVKNNHRTYFQTLKDKFIHGRRYCANTTCY